MDIVTLAHSTFLQKIQLWRLHWRRMMELVASLDYSGLVTDGKELGSRLQTLMFLGLAFVEVLALLGFVLAFIK